MDKESKPAWSVLGLDANLGTVRCGGKLTVRLGCSDGQLRAHSSRSLTPVPVGWPIHSDWKCKARHPKPL